MQCTSLETLDRESSGLWSPCNLQAPRNEAQIIASSCSNFTLSTKVAFALTSNWSRKFISEIWGVWLLLQIRSNWKPFPVDRISEPKRRKIISVSIFTSNDFRPWKIKEKEREREGERKKRSRSHQHRAITGTVPTSPAPCRSARSRSRSRLCLSRFYDFFLGFVCVLRNEWYYVFVW